MSKESVEVNLVPTLDELKKLKKKIKKLRNELDELHEQERVLEKYLKDNCPHPNQFHDKVIFYGNDPLEADTYQVYCRVCNKLIAKGNHAKNRY